MLDIRFIRENLEAVETRLKCRGAGVSFSGFRELDDRRRTLLQEAENLKALRNRVSDEISRAKDKRQVQEQITEMREVSQRIKLLDVHAPPLEPLNHRAPWAAPIASQ